MCVALFGRLCRQKLRWQDGAAARTGHRLRDSRVWSGFGGRIMMAVKADPFFYATVVDQPARTTEAVSVAIGSSLVMGPGLMVVGVTSPMWWVIGGLGWADAVLGVGTWYVVTVGRRLGGRARYDQMLRALGYAIAPQALGFLRPHW